MRRIADYLEANKKTLSKTLFAEKDAVCDLIRAALPSGAPPLKILYTNGKITLKCSSAARNEVFMRREKILHLLREKFPHLQITDIR